MILRDFEFPKLRPPKMWKHKRLKTLVSEDPSTSNKVNLPKHCSDCYHSIFIIFIDHCQVN